MKFRRALSPIALLAAALLLASAAWSQTTTGKVVGTVTDPQQAAIPGASILVTNISTGVASRGATDKEGHFEVLNLPIGSYNVTVEHAGFQKTTTQAQTLQINQTVSFDIAMKLGSSSQSVTVEAAVSGVETENATIGATITGSAIHDLPLNGRNVLDLAGLQPGVTPGNGAVGGFSIAGGRPDSVTYLLDGGMNNDLLSNGVVFNPNPDTIAEFRLLSSDYTAEYGRSGAGVISVVTKSGTNQLHGSAFDFLRNDALNANNFFNNVNGVPRDKLKRNQYGATLGGPISIPGVVNGTDKLFFFVGYQGQRQTDVQTRNQTPTFTPLELAGDFSKSNPDGSGTPDPNVAAFLQANPFFQSDPTLQQKAVIDPTKINAASAKYLALGLIPTSATGLLNFGGSATDNNNQLTTRVDYAPNASDKFSLTVGGLRDLTLNPFANANVPGFPDTTADNTYYVGLSHTHTFSPTLLNEFHFTVQRHNRLQAKPAATLPGPAALGFGVTPDLPIAPPNLDFDTGLSLGFSIQGPSNLVGTTWIYTDAVTWVQGRNTWKMGGGFSAYQQNMAFDFLGNSDFSFAASPGSSGNSYADFLLGIPNFLSQGPNAPSNIRQKTTDGFLQDDWRATNNLTLSLGIRYEYSSPKRDTRGRIFGLDPGKQSTVFANAPLGLVFPGDSGVPLGSNFPDKDNFAPRFGFAWDPTGHGTTSVRGGAGLFYDVLKAEDNFQFNGQPPFASSVNTAFPNVGPGQAGPVTFLSDPFAATGIPNPFPSKAPSPSLDFAAAGFLPFAPPGGVYVDPHIHTPYIYQYNLSVQHQFAQSYVAEINYVGSSSKGLTGLMDINPFVLGTNNRLLNPTALAANASINSFCQGLANSLGLTASAQECPFPIMDSFANVGFANYNSVEMSLTKHVDHNRYFGNAYFTLGYTYGRSIDNSSGFRNNTSTVPFYDHSAFRGPSDFDIANRLVFNGSWGLPFANLWSSGPKTFLQGWRVDPILTWRTGFPLTPGAGLNPNADPSIPGPSGAGDAFLANAAFAPGFSQVTLLNPTLAGNYYFDPKTFSNALTAADPYGLPRGVFRGPGATNLDFALVKDTKVSESVNAEFRAEAFNLFNHAQFNNPQLNIRSTSRFGRITTAADPRIVQLALRLSF